MGKARWFRHPINSPSSMSSVIVVPWRTQTTPHQNTALGRRLSKSFPSTTDQDQTPPTRATVQEQRPAVAHRSRSHKKETRPPAHAPGRLQSSASAPAPITKKNASGPPVRRNLAADSHYITPTRLAPALPPIPGSEASAPPTPTPSYRSIVPLRSPPQSLNAAAERIVRAPSQSPGNVSGVSKKSSESGYASAPESSHVKPKRSVQTPDEKGVPTAPTRPPPSTPTKGPTVAGKEIGRPVLNIGAYPAVCDGKSYSAKGITHVRRCNAEAQSCQGSGCTRTYLCGRSSPALFSPYCQDAQHWVCPSRPRDSPFSLNFFSAAHILSYRRTSPPISSNSSSPNLHNSTLRRTAQASSSSARCPSGR